jgi:hypothetical protein
MQPIAVKAHGFSHFADKRLFLPTGPHPLRARELTTPHPEGLTTRLVPVEVDLKQQKVEA